MILDIAARYAWLAVPSLLALTLCIAVELISQRERYTLADRFPGVLFVLLLPVLAGIILPPLMALWNMLDVSPILDLTGLSRPLQVVVLILMYDFANYWEHRFEHRFIWSIHAVHHSPTELHGANAYGHPLQAISFRYAQERSGTHNLSALMRAFAITMSLRIKATTATFGGFPESMRLLYLALRSGL